MGNTKFVMVIGYRSGRLKVVRLHSKERKEYWECDCDCGGKKVVVKHHLVDRMIRSCGCLQSEVSAKNGKGNATHGGSRTRLYTAWGSMRDRCRNPNHKFYVDYGGRGIKVCREWLDSFVAFRDWALEAGYKKGLWLDRKDNDGDYGPKNCRWTTAKESGRNKRNNVLFEAFGKIKTAGAWVEDQRCAAGVCEVTLINRIVNLNWNVEKAITFPLRSWTRKKVTNGS